MLSSTCAQCLFYCHYLHGVWGRALPLGPTFFASLENPTICTSLPYPTPIAHSSQKRGYLVSWICLHNCSNNFPNRHLLYSPENFTQYSMIIYVGKDSKEKHGWVYLYNRISLLYSRKYHNIVNQPYFNKTFKK